MSYHARGLGLPFGPSIGPTISPGSPPATSPGTPVAVTTMRTSVPMVSAIDMLVPPDCTPPVMYAAPPDPVPAGSVIAYVWPTVKWDPAAAVSVRLPPPATTSSGGRFSYGGTPSEVTGGTPTDIGPTKGWVQWMQTNGGAALAGFIPRPGNDQSASKGVAWAIGIATTDVPLDVIANGLRTAGQSIVNNPRNLYSGKRILMNLGLGLPALVPLAATGVPTIRDWQTFADDYPTVNARILQAVLMVEGSIASLSAALSTAMTPNTGAPAVAIRQAADNLARLVTQGQAALSSVTAARIAAVRAAQSIPGIVSSAKQAMSAATDRASVDAAATAAQQQIAALTASIPAWSSAISTATDVAGQLGRAAAAAPTQFTAESILGMAVTPSVQTAMNSARFEIAKNAVKCQVLMAIKGAAAPAYAALMNNAGIARTLAGQLATSAQSTALSGFAGLSGYRPRRKSWIQRMLGGLGVGPDLDMLRGGAAPGLTVTTSVPSISALQSVATQAVTDIANAATTAKNTIAASAPPGTPPGTTTPDGGFVLPTPTGPSVTTAPSQVPWVWIGVGAAGLAGAGWWLFKSEKKVAENRGRARRRRAAARRYSHA